MAFFAIHIACAATVLSRSLNTVVMAGRRTDTYTCDDLLNVLDEWSDDSNAGGMSSSEEVYLDRELGGSDDDFG